VIDGLLVDYTTFVVGGACWYRVHAPSGTTLATVNDPSGDAEYETVPQFDTTAVGLYKLEWHDLDLRNTLFLKPAFGTEIFSAESAPVGAPLSTGLGNVRGTLFHDKNGDGVRQANEPGLAGIPVDVTNLDTSAVTTVTTDAYGAYGAAVPAGDYTAGPAAGTDPDAVLQTTVGGETRVVPLGVGQTLDATAQGFTDQTGSVPSLALVPQCQGNLTAFGLDVELPADLTGQFVQVQYFRAGTKSLYDAVSFAYNGRFSQPVVGFNGNLKVVNVYQDGGVTHVVIDVATSSKGILRRFLRAGNVQVLTSPTSSNTGTMKPVCRPGYVQHGQVFNVASQVKSLR
jgi:hypothetical protein